MRKSVAVVSGSTSGIGFFIAKALLKTDYKVFVNGTDVKKAETALCRLKEINEDVELLSGDVNDSLNYEPWVHQINHSTDNIDVIIANVGGGKGTNSSIAPMGEFRRFFDLNFFSAVNFTQHLLPLLSDGSNMIFIGSIAGVDPIGAPVPYACAKAALIMYVKEMAARLAHKGVRVNSISPGNVMFEGSTWDEKIKNSPQETRNYIEQNVPLQCFITPEEIANMVITVINTPGLTSQNIVIDGGQTKGHS